jgi:hypothetical protein
MRKSIVATGLAATALAGLGLTMASAQTKPAPARPALAASGGGGTVSYRVTADTFSGFGAGMMGARGAGGMLGAMLGGRMTDPNASARMLNLELGSNRPPAGAPQAEHLPPQVLGVGATLPLLTPPPPKGGTGTPDEIGDYKPRGRILIFWGCGERARPGQPVVIDLAKLLPGQLSPQMLAMTRRNAQQMAKMAEAMAARGDGRGQWRTVGLWPNERTRQTVPSTASLVGDHVVRGNYSPEIRFAMTPTGDYLAPFSFTQNGKVASGAHMLAWRPIARALGYHAMAFGSPGEDTVVMWTSAEMQNAPQPGEYASADEVARLVAQKAMLAPTVSQCAIPAEAVKAMGEGGFITMNAVGPTSTFSFPPRPEKAPANWAPDWVTKVQTRSTFMSLIGMAEMMGGDGREDAGAPDQPKKKKKRSLLDGLISPF